MEDSVNVLKFAESRAEEIMTLMNDVASKEPKLTQQRLPFYMRRRAASHNPKRLPRSLRIKKVEESSAKKKKKHKSHKSLLDDYNSRQKSDSMWLPTHIWFAKRFHMKQMWGYKLPLQATGKRFRSSYRASVRNAVIQDLSYFCCVELRGDRDKLLLKLSSLTDDSCGLNFASETYIDGTREGKCFLYHPNEYPFKAIGPVTFLWKPSYSVKKDENLILNHQLWIWCHPSIADELIHVLIEIFQLKQHIKDPAVSETFEFASKTNYMKTKLHFQKEAIYSNGDITLVNLKDTLVRHRITGPNSLAIITSILNLFSDIKCDEETISEAALKCEVVIDSDKMEVENSFTSCKESENMSNKLSNIASKIQIWNYLKSSKSAYYVPLQIVIGITVEDPRLYLPPNKFNDDNNYAFEDMSILDDMCNPATAFSVLWDENVRNRITASQIPEHVINQERAKYINPREAPQLRNISTGVPIILIHQPETNGYGSGWDIIAPQGWGMAFWIPLIYHGAQPAGVEDYSSMNFESGCPTFPASFPDTKAGFTYEEKLREENLKRFYKYSRAKRPNFKILGINHPFFIPWDVLINDWKSEFLNKFSNQMDVSSCSVFTLRNGVNDDKSFFVIRNHKEINYLKNICDSLNKNLRKSFQFETSLKNDYINLIHHLINQHIYLKSLILVRIKCISRGAPSKFSGIYMPSESDLAALKENTKYFGPSEPKHSLPIDSNLSVKQKRKLLKQEAKAESKDLSRPKIESVMSSSRKIIGYITEGGYSRLGSQGYGIGHCTLSGFLAVVDISFNYRTAVTVLVREQHCFQYRPAIIEIVNNM